jgi:hypothetical protein
MNTSDGNGEQHSFFHDSTLEKPVTALEERQQLLAHHVRLVARKLNHALFVFGAQGGLGKSRTILHTLDEEGIEPILINSHITPLALYTTLFRFRGEETIFFDDCDAMYSSMPHLGLLRSALWGSPRTVTYGSSQLPDGLPSAFETTARFIFAANVMPRRNDAFKAVLSRTDIFELSATNEEVIDLMRSVSGNGFKDLPPEDCRMVIDYIAENADDRQLSMRLLGPSLRKLLYARGEGIDWKPMIKSQLRTLGRKNQTSKRLDSKTKDLRVLKKAIQKNPDSVQQQEEAWRKATGKSRASFYRCLQRLRAEQGE